MGDTDFQNDMVLAVAELRFAVTTVWLIVTGIGILTMQIGFALLETGAIGSKNIKGTLLKNISDNSIGAVVWLTFGWGLFSGNNNAFASGDGATFINNHNPSEYARMFQQFGFAATATTLVSGAILGRCRFSVYLLFSMFMTGIFYPIQAHWAWSPQGWLAQLGFLDFAGGAVVHVFGGTAALAGAIICGPRYGRFNDDTTRDNASVSLSGGSKTSRSVAYIVSLLVGCAGRCCPRCLPVIGILTGNSEYLRRVRDLPAHSVVLYALGGLFLFIGWFSFNAGSVPVVGDVNTNAYIASKAAVNTLMASGSGTLFALGFCYLMKTRLDLGLIINSMLTCTVVITPAAGYVALWVALLAGPISVLAFTFFRYLVLHVFGVDDPLDVFAVHASGGAIGMLVVGLLHEQQGFFYTGQARFLGVEMLGTLAIGMFGFIVSLLYFIIMNKTVGIIYSKDDQLAGLDFMHFELESQTDLDWINVQEYNVRERIKREQAARKRVSKGVLVSSNPSMGRSGSPVNDSSSAPAAVVVPINVAGL